MRHFILLLLVFLSVSAFSQGTVADDSLLKKIENTVSSEGKIKIYNQLSKSYWYSSPSKTLEYGQKALDLALEEENDTMIIDSRINIGIGYSSMADYDHAMFHFMQSLSLSEQINYKEGTANSLSNMATIYDYLGNYAKAKEYYLKALKINKEMDYDSGVIGTLNNLGILYTKTKEYDEALECYNEALTIEKANDEKQMLAITMTNIGDVYDYNGNREKALEYYRNSFQTGKELDSKTLIIASMINIGRMKIGNNESDSALYYYNEASVISGKAGFRSITKDIYFYISEAYDKRSDPSNALIYYKKYSLLKDSLLSEESNNKITELQVIYETEAKQKENDLLQKENNYQKNLRNFFVALSVLVIVLAIISYRNFRNKKKSNILLQDKNIIITVQKEKLAESLEKLRASEELYRSLVSTSPDGIVITDLNADITYASPALLKIYDYPETEDLLGKKTIEFIEKHDKIKAIRYFRNLISTKISDITELKGIRSDGAVIDIEINGGTLENNEGKVYSLFFIFRDITVRKQIEEQQCVQKEMIYRQQQEIATLEIQKKEQENINLKSDLEFKNKELASKAMYIIQNNELVDSVIEKLKLLEKKTEEKERISQFEIRSLINDLRTTIRRDSWKEFETHFTQVHSDFYINLQNKFPDLTVNEKKLCAFLSLNLSTKEISDITSKSIHSINVARTRLRQKLGMTNTDDSLSAFLSQF
jgi:PAS domain S-box-containing protein